MVDAETFFYGQKIDEEIKNVSHKLSGRVYGVPTKVRLHNTPFNCGVPGK